MLDSFENIEASPPFSGDIKAALQNLVDGQLRPAGVRDPRLFQAMGTIPRTHFVPASQASVAFRDGSFLVAPGRYLLDPTLLARMIEATDLRSDEVVLDLAPATGYSTAILSSLASRVVALEGDSALAEKLHRNVQKLQMQNVQILGLAEVEVSDVFKSCHVVLINGAVETMPMPLMDSVQDGTRIAALVVSDPTSEKTPFPLCEARLYFKANGRVSFRVLFETQAPRLEMFDAPRGFVF